MNALTERDLEHIYNNLERLFGDRLPHPEREPRRFAYYVKIYKHLVDLNHK